MKYKIQFIVNYVVVKFALGCNICMIPFRKKKGNAEVSRDSENQVVRFTNIQQKGRKHMDGSKRMIKNAWWTSWLIVIKRDCSAVLGYIEPLHMN